MLDKDENITDHYFPKLEVVAPNVAIFDLPQLATSVIWNQGLASLQKVGIDEDLIAAMVIDAYFGEGSDITPQKLLSSLSSDMLYGVVEGNCPEIDDISEIYERASDAMVNCAIELHLAWSPYFKNFPRETYYVETFTSLPGYHTNILTLHAAI